MKIVKGKDFTSIVADSEECSYTDVLYGTIIHQ